MNRFKIAKENSIIIEVKYDKGKEGMIDQITNQFGLRLSKFSKYTYGIVYLYQ